MKKLLNGFVWFVLAVAAIAFGVWLDLWILRIKLDWVEWLFK